MVGLQLSLSLSLSAPLHAAARTRRDEGIPTTDAARARPASTDRGPEPVARGRDTDTGLSSLRAPGCSARMRR